MACEQVDVPAEHVEPIVRSASGVLVAQLIDLGLVAVEPVHRHPADER
jgi:hypothetical protein